MASMAATAARVSSLCSVNSPAAYSSTSKSRNCPPECSSSRSSSSHGLGWTGAAAILRCGTDFLKERRKRSSESRAAAVDSIDPQDEYPVGAFGPLYADLKTVTVTPSPGRKAEGLRCSRNTEIRRLAASVDGGVTVEASRTFTTEQVLPRIGKVSRVTKETSVEVELNLDGTGICDCDTGIPFLDHMLDQLASHGLLDVKVKARGDIHIDDHHTNEDIGLSVGTALLQALGDRKGIYRFGDFTAPLDEALIHVVLDLSGRPYLGYTVDIPTQRVGTYDTQLVEHFFQSLVNTSGMTLHIRKLAGNNSHHIIEATFKAFARALRQALEYDLRRRGSVPSSKGVLSRA
ncbi:hypothetical protein R1sor_020656 [Riccia sorocarpa]|uniref:Imidazoleglycerol-phosphate dehydratase n=1 Tax=Riccia sorocarpa TaxID=122646 RepID=A0ABD3GET2_9MARC